MGAQAAPAWCQEPVAQELVVVVAGPLSGDASPYGTSALRAARIFADEVNSKGGLDIAGSRYTLRIRPGDDKADPREAASLASAYAADASVVAVVGHFISSCCLAADPAYAEAGLLQLSYGCTSPVAASDTLWTFRTTSDDREQALAAVRYIKEVMGLERVAVLFEDDEHGRALMESFSAKASEFGLAVVGQDSYERDSISFRAQLTKLRTRRPEVLFVPGLYSQAGLIVSQARELGMRNLQFLGSPGMVNDEFLRIAGPAAEGALASSPLPTFDSNPKLRNFARKFNDRYGTPPDWIAASAYDAISMVAQAMQAAGAADRKAIRDALASRTSPEYGHEGVTGLTYFDDKGAAQKPVYFQQVKSGKWVHAKRQLEARAAAE